MHTKIFVTGLVLFLISFAIPLDEDLYGYSVAFMFLNAFSDGEIFDAFLMVITNIAALVMILSYAKFFNRFISLFGVAGCGVAIYWLIQVGREPSLHSYATICWTIGIILLTTGYELKRRLIFNQTNNPNALANQIKI